MKKKIAIFQTDLEIGGIEKSLINLLNRIDYDKYDIDLYLFDKGTFFNMIPKKVKVTFLNAKSYLKFIPFSFYKLFSFSTIKKKYDVAIDFNGYNNSLSSYVLNTQANKKVIWIHNDYEEKMKYEKKFKILFNLSKKKYKFFDEIVAVSKGAKESFINVTSLNVNYVIPNYIDADKIIQASKEEVEFSVDKEKINLCFLGRLVPQKGLEELFPLIKKYKKNNCMFHLYIIGNGPLYEKLVQEVEDLDLFDNVTFMGNKQNPFPYLRKCDYLILNSKYEGQGMVALEAKTLGMKIIMPKRLEKYLNIDYIDIKDMKSIKKISKRENRLEKYSSEIDKSIEELLGGE